MQLCEDLFNRIKDDDSGDTLYSVEVSNACPFTSIDNGPLWM